MIQGSDAEESRSALESAGRRPARKTLEKNSQSLVRKSERVNKNSLEATISQKRTDRAEDKSSPTLVWRSERGKSQSPLKCNKKIDASCRKSGAKDGPERVDAGKSEAAGAKRRKLYTSPFKSFKSLFCQSKTNSVSNEPSEKPELQRTLAQSNCFVPEADAVDKHQSVSSPSEKKLRKKSKIFANDSDLRDGITPKIQTKEVLNVVKEKLSEHIVDHEFPESRCKVNPIELDSSARIESKILSVDTLPVSDKDRPMERETEAHARVCIDCPVSPSHDNRSSTQNVESVKVEVSDETRVTSKNEAGTLKENSLHDNNGVDVEETLHSRERDADVVNHVVARAISDGFANVSHSRDEVNESSGRSASSPRSRRFVEYWVPACLSNLQLEQYCAALLANSVSLCSSLKSDPVGAIRNLLIALRKVCNHPFLVDPDLSTTLLQNSKETENLEVGIQASGKLQLLETLLLEMKRRGWRVLILYESSIYARDKIGAILDDFLLQRYGQDSFEHINGGATVPSKKQAAVNRFNDKNFGRFLFLLEIRACASSIKLSSLDSIIIFNSDWNPINDIRALQKVIMDSQHGQINIIRLFSPLTVEENAMFLSKQNVTDDNSMHNISRCHRDKLLMRGASALFHELEKFHCIADQFSCMISSLESSLLQDVAQEFISIYLDSDRQMGDRLSIYLKVQHNGEGHGKFRLVADEMDTLLTEESWPHDIWSKLLKSRSPQWKFVSDSSKRKRKIVNYNESEDVKKFIKVVHDSIDVTWMAENQKVVTSDKGYKCAEDVSQVIPEDVCIPSGLHNTALESGAMFKESFKLHETKKSLHLLLKPELQKLCELLNLSEDVKKMAEQFVEYVVENHHVTREPVTLLQAFQLSVCWIAASLRKQKISSQDSLTLARKHLKFCCSAEDTDNMYLKMVLLKELFIHNIMDDTDTVSPFTDTSGDSVVEINPVTSDRKSLRVLDVEKLMVKIIRQINKKCRERMKLLTENQRKELEELQKSSDEEKRQLERDYKVEVAVVRTIHIHNLSMASEKVKALEDQHSKRLEEHRNNLSIRSKSLEHKHSSEKDKENKLTSCWKEDIVKEQLELLQKITHHNFEDGRRKCNSNEQLRNLDIQKECHTLEDQEILNSRPGTQADSIEDCQSTSPGEVSGVLPVSSDAGNNCGVVDSVVSDLAEVLPENFASICSETGQVACGEAANFGDTTSEIEVPESSSVDVLPLKSKTSAITDRPSPEKTFDCQTTSQQLSQSAVLITESGLLNPSIDVPLALSNGKEVSALHESEAPSLGHSVRLPLSPAALDNEVGNSSLNSSLGRDNVPSSQINFDTQAVKRRPEIPLATFASGFEQSDSQNKFGQPVLYTTTEHANVDPIAKAVHQLPATEKQCELPPSTITTGSTQSQSDSQRLRIVPGLSSVNPTAAESVAQPPAIEGQPQFPSSSGTPRTEKSYADIQLEQLGHAENDHFNVEPSTAEAVHQLPATKRQLELPCCIATLGREQDHSDIQLDESLPHRPNHTFVIASTPGAVHWSPATERQVSSHSELSHAFNDHLLLNTTSGHFDPSAGEAVQLSSATDSIISPSLEQSQSGIENGPPLLQIANNCNIDPFAAEAPHQLSTAEEQLELPSANISARSEQSDPDYQNDNLLCQTATNHSYVEPSAGEAANQLPHSPILDSSSSQPQSCLPVSEELPSIAFGSTLNVDARPNPYPSTSTCSIAITQSPPISRPGARNAVSDFPANLIPGTIVASTESVRMPNFPYLDPLESELVRVQKEADHSVKEYEDMKQLLNSECEKEIEEIVAQIRKKYETQIVEHDAAMKYKKNELNVYHNKVYMNMILAEILRKKFSEPKVFVPPVIRQDNVQQQLRRQPPPVLADTSASVQSLGNLQGMHSSVPSRHSALGSASSAAPIPRNVASMQNPVGPCGPSAAALQNFLRAGVPSAASLQNSVRPRSPSAAALQNFIRAGAPFAAASLQNSVRPHSPSTTSSRNYIANNRSSSSQNSMRPGVFPVASSPSSLRSGGPSAVASSNYSRPCIPAAYSPDPMRPGVTTGIPPATPLPRSAAASPSGLPSANPSAVQQALPRPLQVLNHPAALLSDSSARPVSTASKATPTVNLDSGRGMCAPAPHLRSTVPQHMAPGTTFSTRIPGPPSHPTFTNVSLPTPMAVSQHSSHHRRLASIDNVSALPMHKTTVSLTLPSNGVSTNQQVVCLSDSD